MGFPDMKTAVPGILTGGCSEIRCTKSCSEIMLSFKRSLPRARPSFHVPLS